MTPQPPERKQQPASIETRSAETPEARPDAAVRRTVPGPDPEATRKFLEELREATKAARAWPEWKRRVFQV
jgi:hypothetical protein